ncbi:MAG: YggS family pyridoxal phosphate-dependent enzyme [Magnetococcales bacterium]|nr:YggS family pyridoxal phosphate-dependent enzyme [Magnetococcales bacterium]
MHTPSTTLHQIRARMAAACERAGRDPAAVRLVVVSKTRSPEEIRAVAACGQTLFAENRVQEARDKLPRIADPTLAWHLIGPLQRNKVKAALEIFHMIHTVDSLELAEEISKRAETGPLHPFPVLMQINVGREPQKSGVTPEEALPLAHAMAALPGIALRGVMTIPPFSLQAEESRPWFQALSRLKNQIAQEQIDGVSMDELSMGMSHDYEIAVEEGATLVRIGSAVFAPT